MLARLGTAPIAIGAFAALVAEADAYAKGTNQAQYKYQTKPMKGHKCSGCALYAGHNKCNLVTGSISPNGWCTAFAAK
jgi:hypothetical protein